MNAPTWLATPAFVAVALSLLGAAVILPGLGTSGLWDPWEPRYVRAAEEMADRGDWLVPHFRGEPRLNRPPLSYWMIGISQALLGRSETASRLPFAMLAIVSAAALGWALTRRGRAFEGVLAGGLLLASPQWSLLARFAMPSSPLASWLALLLAVGIAARRDRSRTAAFGTWGAVVLLLSAAALTDFPRGLLLPAWAVLGWGTFERDRLAAIVLASVAIAYHAGQLTYTAPLILLSYVLAAVGALVVLVRRAAIPWRALLWGAVVVLVLVAPWFVAVASLADDELKVFNYKYGLNLGEDPGDHTGPYWQVLAHVAAGGFLAAAASIGGFWRVALSRPAPDRESRLFGGAALGGLAFFLLSEARMGHFYVVLQPALTGLAAVGLAWLLARRDLRALAIVAALVGLVSFIREEPSSVLASATVKSSLYGQEVASPAIWVAGAWLVLVAIGWLSRQRTWSLASLVPALAFSGYMAQHVVPALAPKKSFHATWQRYVEARASGEPLALYGVTLDSAFYYARDAEELYDWEDVREYFASGSGRWLALAPRRVGEVESLAAGRIDRIEDVHSSCVLVRFRGTQSAPSR